MKSTLAGQARHADRAVNVFAEHLWRAMGPVGRFCRRLFR